MFYSSYIIQKQKISMKQCLFVCLDRWCGSKFIAETSMGKVNIQTIYGECGDGVLSCIKFTIIFEHCIHITWYMMVDGCEMGIILPFGGLAYYILMIGMNHHMVSPCNT